MPLTVRNRRRRDRDRGADRLLWQAIRHGWRWTAGSLVASAVGAVALLAFPAAFAAAVDGQLAGTATTSGLWWLVAVLAVLVAGETLGQLATPLSVATGTRWLRHRLLGHVIALGLPGRDRFAAGDVVSRLMSGTSQASGAGPAMAKAVSSLIVSAGGVVGLALIDPWLAVTFLVGVPIGAVLVKVFVSATSQLATDYLAVYDKVSSRLVEALAGIRTIRACGTVPQEITRVLPPAGDLARLGHATWRAYGRMSWWASLLAPAIQLAVLGVAGYGVSAGRITPGQFLAALGYASLGLGLLGQAGAFMALAEARGGARRLAEILDQRPTRAGTANLPTGPGTLVLHAVTVRRGDRLVLDHVDLTVPPGRSMAVVGGSAAGKSTLAAVAGRLITPDEGQVLLDGVPLDAADPGAVSREISYAFEQPALLGATVAEAIAMGSEPADRARIEAAARIAHADRFIDRLPAGYDTPLHSAPMSGGEAQRLGLARAIAKGGRVLILDDATSSLDTVTETRVRQVLTESLTGQTRLVIAHRAATVAGCDLVAWLDNGRIRAVAPHHVLWREPAYRGLFGPAAQTKDPRWATA